MAIVYRVNGQEATLTPEQIHKTFLAQECHLCGAEVRIIFVTEERGEGAGDCTGCKTLFEFETIAELKPLTGGERQ